MCFKTSSVKRFGDVYTPQYSFEHFLFHIFVTFFYRGDSDGEGGGRPPPPPVNPPLALPRGMLLMLMMKMKAGKCFLGSTPER